MLHEKCPLRASPISRDIPSDIIPLAQISHPWNSMEDTPEFDVIPPHILLMSEIEVFKSEIESLKGKIINNMQDVLDKRLFSSTDHNTKTVVNAMASQTKYIMEEIVSKTEVISSKITEVSGTNDSNRMEIVIDKEEEEDGNEYFDECFDEDVLDLRRKIKWEVSLEQTKKRKITVGYHHGKMIFYHLPISYL